MNEIDNSTQEKLKILNEYIKLNFQAHKNLKEKKLKDSCRDFISAHTISKKLDLIKQADSLTNIGITQYYIGKFNESLQSLESAFKISEKLYNNDLNSNTDILFLHLRIICNLCQISLANTKTKEALDYNQKALAIIIETKDNDTKVLLFREFLYIYYRIENTLDDFYESLKNYQMNEKDEKEEEDDSQSNRVKEARNLIKNKTLFCIHKFLREKDFSLWIKLLEENIAAFKDNSNIPAYIFSVLNQSVVKYIQTGSMDSIKEKMNSIVKSLKINGKLKSSEKILTEWKSKIECGIEIYKQILDLEKKLSFEINSFDQEKANIKVNSNGGFIKVLLKHSLNYLSENKNMDKGFKQQIEETLKLIENREVDLSRIDVMSFDSEIIRSVKILFNNLFLINRKFVMLKRFKQFVQGCTGTKDLKSFRTIFNEEKRYKKLKTFKEKSLKSNLLEGENFLKINYSSTGKIEHFYKISNDDNALLVYKNKGSKSFKKFIFGKEILQIKYGMKSQNLQKKYKEFKSSQLKIPWLYISFILKKSSIDLYMKEEQISPWFFGLNEFVKKKNLKVMIMSNSGFVIRKLKLKLIKKIMNEVIGEEDEEGEKKKSALLTDKNVEIIMQMKKFLKIDQLGLDQLSFAKILLLYLKLFNLNMDKN